MLRAVMLSSFLVCAVLFAEPAVERLATGFVFTEGPALAPDGSVYFTDLPTYSTYRWVPGVGVKQVQSDNGQANGLAFDRQGNLLVCEQGRHRITRRSVDGEWSVLVDRFLGKKLNSPNDLYLSSNGGIYFTDPRYGNRDSMELDHESVYFLDAEGQLRLVADGFVRPNGIVGTPDGQWLYVADHGAKETYRFRLAEDGSILGREIFAAQGSDGMALDSQGNVYLTDANVDIYGADGQLLQSIELPERPANVMLLSEDPVILFVTARTSIYRVELD